MKHIVTVLLVLLLYPTTITPDRHIEPPKTAHKAVMVQRKAEVSRGAERVYLGEFEVTAYNLTTPTCEGKKTKIGVVAVDPDIIQLGTRLYIEGYGSAVAGDTGGDIKKRRLDVWIPGDAAWEWGRRKNVKVWRE